MKRTLFLSLLHCGLTVYAGHEFIPIQERAQGQSLAGAHLLNDSLFSNPAGSAFTQVYSVEGIYSVPKALAVSILDTKSSDLGGALGYFRKPREGFSDPDQGVKLNLMGKISEHVGVGLGGKMMWGTDRASFKDIDAGFLFRIMPFTIGFVARNLLFGSQAFDQSQEWGLGTQFNYQQILFLSASVLGTWRAFNPYQVGVGMEFITPYYFSVKGGYRFQPTNRTAFWSTGLSLQGPKVAVHYTAEFPASGVGTIEHVLGTTLLF